MTRKSHCTALVVDDEPAITELVTCVLEASGISVISAHDGYSALEIISNSVVDVVITDICMDGMSGFELLTNIKHTDSMIKVIMMTSFDSYDMLKRSLKAGAYDYLNKPLNDHSSIVTATQRAFDSVRLMRENVELIDRLKESNAKVTASNKRLLHLNKQLRKLAITDSLTQLFNRRYIDDWIQNYAISNSGNDTKFSVILIDVDYFKRINDSYGHDGGDEVLRQLANLLGNCGRENDIVGRYGGEEFIVVLPGSDDDEALQAAERIRSLVEKTSVRISSGTVRFTVSMGVSTNMNMASTSADDKHSNILGFVSGRELVVQADKALYAAKDSGRNRCIHFHELHSDQVTNSLPEDQVANS